MSALVARITEVLDLYFDEVRRDGYIADGVDAAHVAERIAEVVAREQRQVSRQIELFLDDGNRARLTVALAVLDLMPQWTAEETKP